MPDPKTIKPLTLDKMHKMIDKCTKLEKYGYYRSDYNKLVSMINKFFGVK